MKFIILLLTFCCHSVEGKRFFEGRPYEQVCSLEGESRKIIRCFDPLDAEFDNEGVPFLTLEITGDGEILEMGRTSNFSGKRIVALARALQKEHGVKRLKLTDRALTPPCDWDGKWCCDEALMHVSLVSVFVHGKSYYETLGAIPDDPSLPEAERFLHEMNVSRFVDELSCYSKSTVKLIAEICEALDLRAPDLTMGQLAKALYRAGKGNEYAHTLWHRFYDDVISENRTALIPYLMDHSSDHTLIALVKDEMGKLFDQGLEDLSEDFTEIRLRSFYRELNLFAHSPVFFLIAQASDQSLRRTVKVNGIVKNNSNLLKVYQLEPKVSSQKTLYSEWMSAKNKIRKSCRFTFNEEMPSCSPLDTSN